MKRIAFVIGLLSYAAGHAEAAEPKIPRYLADFAKAFTRRFDPQGFPEARLGFQLHSATRPEEIVAHQVMAAPNKWAETGVALDIRKFDGKRVTAKQVARSLHVEGAYFCGGYKRLSESFVLDPAGKRLNAKCLRYTQDLVAPLLKAYDDFRILRLEGDRYGEWESRVLIAYSHKRQEGLSLTFGIVEEI